MKTYSAITLASLAAMTWLSSVAAVADSENRIDVTFHAGEDAEAPAMKTNLFVSLEPHWSNETATLDKRSTYLQRLATGKKKIAIANGTHVLSAFSHDLSVEFQAAGRIEVSAGNQSISGSIAKDQLQYLKTRKLDNGTHMIESSYWDFDDRESQLQPQKRFDGPIFGDIVESLDKKMKAPGLDLSPGWEEREKKLLDKVISLLNFPNGLPPSEGGCNARSAIWGGRDHCSTMCNSHPTQVKPQYCRKALSQIDPYGVYSTLFHKGGTCSNGCGVFIQGARKYDACAMTGAQILKAVEMSANEGCKKCLWRAFGSNCFVKVDYVTGCGGPAKKLWGVLAVIPGLILGNEVAWFAGV